MALIKSSRKQIGLDLFMIRNGWILYLCVVPAVNLKLENFELEEISSVSFVRLFFRFFRLSVRRRSLSFIALLEQNVRQKAAVFGFFFYVCVDFCGFG